jgi:hypothetical protein
MSHEQSSGQELPAELTALEVALRQLTPAQGALDRDRLMYLAGQASAAPARANGFHLPWPLATAALALVSLGLGGRLLYVSGLNQRIAIVERAGNGGESPIAVDIASALQSVQSAGGVPGTTSGEFNYMQLRNAVLNHGADALPAGPVRHGNATPSAPAHMPSWRDDFFKTS